MTEYKFCKKCKCSFINYENSKDCPRCCGYIDPLPPINLEDKKEDEVDKVRKLQCDI